jgi:RNA polymerase sigma-70 factor (ECF subfamily)
MDDAGLIVRILSGDRESFGVLVARYHEDCRRLAARLLGNLDDADDAVQETFLRAFRGLGGYDERERFRAWLYRILVNRCRSLARQRAQRGRRFVSGDADGASEDRGAARIEMRDALQASLITLPESLREAVLLKYGEGLDYHEMARITGASVPALKMRVKRACAALRPRLEGLFDDRA